MPDIERADHGNKTGPEQAGLSKDTADWNRELRERGERLDTVNAQIEEGFGAAYAGAAAVDVDDHDQPKDVPPDGAWHRFGSGAEEGDAGLVAVTEDVSGRTEETFARQGSEWHYMYEHRPAGGSDVIAASVQVGRRGTAYVEADGRITKVPWKNLGGEHRPEPYNAENEEDLEIRDWLEKRVKRQAGADFRHLEDKRPAA